VYCENYETVEGKYGNGYSLMVRDRTHKIVMYNTRDEGELYDLVNDPNESVNLWHSADHSALKLCMMERLCHRMAETIDPLPEKIAPW
jgi:arylsulfatase